MTHSAQSTTNGDPLRRLRSLGLREPWHVAFLLPDRWDDLTETVDSFPDPGDLEQPRLVRGVLGAPPNVRFSGGHGPRLVGSILDGAGHRLSFTLFGDTRGVQKQFEAAVGTHILLFGPVRWFNGRLTMSGPEVLDPTWAGKLRPVYPGKVRVIKPATVRERVLGLLPHAIIPATDWLADELADFGTAHQLAHYAGGQGWSLEQILYYAHQPPDLARGQQAQRALEKLAALGLLKQARGNHPQTQRDTVLALPPMRERAAALEAWEQANGRPTFRITDEQKQAAAEIWKDVRGARPMRRVLSGDTGTGKSATYCLVAAVTVDAGGTAVILLPNDQLAQQMHRDIRHWWPDLDIQLVTGSTDTIAASPLIVGTTALLHRNFSAPDLLICDEQQKFSVQQRQGLVGPTTHLLEVTATCIPRTQALLRYSGVLDVSKLLSPHTAKTIHTRIWCADGIDALFGQVRRTVANGAQVIVVYPRRDTSIENNAPDQRVSAPLPSVEDAAPLWEQCFPGRVRIIHATRTPEEKTAALADMRDHKADVILCTTILEIGINLPDARHIVVVHPERYGLSTLHQLRGRVARTGGEGWFDLFLPVPPDSVRDAVRQRLEVLTTTSDGFAVAEADMRIRGVGDLGVGATQQSGADQTFLFGRGVSMQVLDEVLQERGCN